jgi:hypothetical protein
LLLLLNIERVPYYHGGVVVQLSDYRNTMHISEQEQNPVPHIFRMLLQPNFHPTLSMEDLEAPLDSTNEDLDICMVRF